MTHTYEELHDMTVAQMRDVAQGVEHEAVAGYSTMHKEDLLKALCTAFGIEAHVHHEVMGIDKGAIKARIRELKLERAEAINSGNGKELKRIRRQIHRLKRSIRRATV
jgi:DNA-binding IclR family transcriptional regulator